jgi:hypothetical protein
MIYQHNNYRGVNSVPDFSQSEGGQAMSVCEIMRLVNKGFPRLIIVQMVAEETMLDKEEAEKVVNEVILNQKRMPIGK